MKKKKYLGNDNSSKAYFTAVCFMPCSSTVCSY